MNSMVKKLAAVIMLSITTLPVLSVKHKHENKCSPYRKIVRAKRGLNKKTYDFNSESNNSFYFDFNEKKPLEEKNDSFIFDPKENNDFCFDNDSFKFDCNFKGSQGPNKENLKPFSFDLDTSFGLENKKINFENDPRDNSLQHMNALIKEEEEKGKKARKKRNAKKQKRKNKQKKTQKNLSTVSQNNKSKVLEKSKRKQQDKKDYVLGESKKYICIHDRDRINYGGKEVLIFIDKKRKPNNKLWKKAPTNFLKNLNCNKVLKGAEIKDLFHGFTSIIEKEFGHYASFIKLPIDNIERELRGKRIQIGRLQHQSSDFKHKIFAKIPASIALITKNTNTQAKSLQKLSNTTYKIPGHFEIIAYFKKDPIKNPEQVGVCTHRFFKPDKSNKK